MSRLEDLLWVEVSLWDFTFQLTERSWAGSDGGLTNHDSNETPGLLRRRRSESHFLFWLKCVCDSSFRSLVLRYPTGWQREKEKGRKKVRRYVGIHYNKWFLSIKSLWDPYVTSFVVSLKVEKRGLWLVQILKNFQNSLPFWTLEGVVLKEFWVRQKEIRHSGQIFVQFGQNVREYT